MLTGHAGDGLRYLDNWWLYFVMLALEDVGSHGVVRTGHCVEIDVTGSFFS